MTNPGTDDVIARGGEDVARAPEEASPERRVQELRVIHAASMRLHRLRDAEILARDVIAILKDVVDHDYAAVYLIDGDNLVTFSVSDRGLGADVLDADKRYLESLKLKVGQNVTGWVARHGTSLVIPDVSKDPRYLDSRPGVVSELCVPMRSRNNVIGVINLESRRAAAYSDYDQRVLEIVASQIAIAIENSRMLERTVDFQRLRILSELTGGVAHDLGNLLQVAAASLDLLALGPSPGGADRDALRQVSVAVDKSIELTRGLLNIGRPSHAGVAVADLGEVLRNAAALLNVLAGPNVALEVSPAPGTCIVRATPGQIEQILMNLVVNARQAIADRGELRISTRCFAGDDPDPQMRGHVCLRVQDSGAGMDSATLDKALEPYFTTRADGSGLGLATVAAIVADLGGRMDIDSRPGAGTTFSIALPLAAANCCA